MILTNFGEISVPLKKLCRVDGIDKAMDGFLTPITREVQNIFIKDVC